MDLNRTLDLKSNPMDSSHFENNFKRTINCPAIRANLNEPIVRSRSAEPEPKTWSRSQKLSDSGSGAWILGSGSTEILCGASDLYANNTMFFSDFLDQIVPEPEPKNLDPRSWSLKFEYRLHSFGAQRTYRRYHCSVTYVTHQWRSYHANFSFLVT